MSTLPMSPGELEEDDEEPSGVAIQDQKYGRYRLCFELASGGMGKVYLARAEGPAGFEKLVALKRIHPHLAKKRAFVDMFLDEARIASKISHPNVCSVFDFGEQDGTFYIAMEYMVGEPLSRIMMGLARLEEGGGPRRRLFGARIVADACEGLHAAHVLKDSKGQALNVVHRDVSPHNIFITFDGSVRIVDFGIARAANQLHETTTGSVKGKWAYMSPEQARGKTLDCRTDVWSLGVIMWELATGMRLFRRKTQTETVLAVTGDEIPRPRDLDPGVPEGLDVIVMKALQRDVDKRYRTARQMGRALLKFLGSQGDPIGMPDLADWMEGMFEKSHGRKQTLLDLANQAGISIPSVHLTPSAEDSSGVRGSSSPSEAPTRGRRDSERPSQAPTSRGNTPQAGDTISDKSLIPDVLRGEEAAPAAATPAPRESAREVTGETPVLPERGSLWPWALAIVLLLAGGTAGMAVGGIGPFASDGSTPEEPSPGLSPTADEVSEPSDLPDDLPSGIDPANIAPLGSRNTLVPEGAEAQTEADAETVPDPEVEASAAAAEAEAAQAAAQERERSAQERRERLAEQRLERLQKQRQERAAMEQGSGVVNVVTQGGWGVVYVNGRNHGETPARITLPAGRHVLEVRPNDRRPGRRVPILIRAGETRRVSVPIGG